MRVLRSVWIGALAGPLLAGAAHAEERSFTCPFDGFTVYRDPGATGALSVVVRTGDPAVVELHGAWGDIVLPATNAMIDAGTIAAEGVWPAQVPMPDPAAIDVCIAAAERKDPGIMRGRRGDEVLARCKAEAPSTAPVAVTLSVGIIVFEPPQAQGIIKRRHAGEDDAASERHGVATMAACSLVQP